MLPIYYLSSHFKGELIVCVIVSRMRRRLYVETVLWLDFEIIKIAAIHLDSC